MNAHADSSSTSTKPTPDVEAQGLDTPIQFCPGVGPKRARLLESLGVYVIRDLLWLIPRGYEDYHHVIPIAHLSEGQTATVIAEVTYSEPRRTGRRSRVRHILNASVKDATGEMDVVWFNQPYLTERVQPGATLRLHGKVDGRQPFVKMSSPKMNVIGGDAAPDGEILPLYPLCEGLTQRVMRQILKKALERFGGELEEWAPRSVLEREGFIGRKEAFQVIHLPQPGDGAPIDSAPQDMNLLFDAEGDDDGAQAPSVKLGAPESRWENARQRLVFEEFLLHQFTLRVLQGRIKQYEGIAHPAPNPDPLGGDDWRSAPLDPSNPLHWPAIFVRDLPFELTDEQRKTCRQIQSDMTLASPMNRLLQGDVGSGKTVVTIYAMTLAASGGAQAAMMAPTELLAQQHAASIREFTKTIPGLQTVVLTGAVKGKERRVVLDALKNGSAQLVVGTHALFQEGVEFDRLGLVAVDEQHKFGVEQREKLVKKGSHPDLLSATATPIPRTLSLTVFGDMDVSTIASLPPGRPPIVTRWTHWANETKLWPFVDEKLNEGQQAYIVCPAIDPSETMPNLPSTEEVYEAIVNKHLPDRRVALLHGRHSSEEKDNLMRKARDGSIDALVATTVIEVGVDLPNATLMIVLGAERFGLAQLHQLRGRVGRGVLKSYCILVTPEQLPPYAEERMRLLEKTRDGFVIAESDLKLRGPGEVFGARQSGKVRFYLADPMRDGDLLQRARDAAWGLYDIDAELAMPDHAAMKREIKAAYGRMSIRRPS